jgi:hypothetical protein
MSRYAPSTPRAVLGLTAVAMATMTVAALVVLPATLDAANVEPYTVAMECHLLAKEMP